MDGCDRKNGLVKSLVSSCWSQIAKILLGLRPLELKYTTGRPILLGFQIIRHHDPIKVVTL